MDNMEKTMYKILLIISLLLACPLRAEPEQPPSYFSHEEIEQAVVALGDLEYPLTQGEVLKKQIGRASCRERV